MPWIRPFDGFHNQPIVSDTAVPTTDRNRLCLHHNQAVRSYPQPA